MIVNRSLASFYGRSARELAGRTPAELGLVDAAALAGARSRGTGHAVVRGVALTDAAGCERRFDVTVAEISSAERGSTFTLEVATEIPAGGRIGARAIGDAEDLVREIGRLESEILEVSQREHERIGHDLHDGLGQELTAASLQLKALDDAVARDAPHLSARLRVVRDAVEQSIATTRAIAQGFSPGDLDRSSFTDALEKLCASSEAVYGVSVTFLRRSTCDLRDLSGAADLYRIAQEAIRNAAKHADAKEIRLTLSVEPHELALVIDDDGRGIVAGAEARGGMGLKIMRYRAGVVGASLNIEARKGGGTTVRCTLRTNVEKPAALA